MITDPGPPTVVHKSKNSAFKPIGKLEVQPQEIQEVSMTQTKLPFKRQHRDEDTPLVQDKKEDILTIQDSSQRRGMMSNQS